MNQLFGFILLQNKKSFTFFLQISIWLLSNDVIWLFDTKQNFTPYECSFDHECRDLGPGLITPPHMNSPCSCPLQNFVVLSFLLFLKCSIWKKIPHWIRKNANFFCHLFFFNVLKTRLRIGRQMFEQIIKFANLRGAWIPKNYSFSNFRLLVRTYSVCLLLQSCLERL